MQNAEVDLKKSDSLDAFDLYFDCITACHSINGEDVECITACIATHLDKEHETWLLNLFLFLAESMDQWMLKVIRENIFWP